MSSSEAATEPIPSQVPADATSGGDVDTTTAPEATTLFHDLTAVTFKPLTSDEIDSYLEKIDPLDKGGAYAA